MKRAIVVCVAAVAAASSCGCASTSPKSAFNDVAHTVDQRSGHRLRWDQAGDDDREVDRAVDKLLSEELTVDAAVQIALLRNPMLRATFEDLGVAQADLVQAGLLKNPVFSARITTAERDALDPNLVLGVTQSFLDLLMIPARKKIARTQLEATKLRVGDAVLALAADVRSAFFMVQGAQQVVMMRRIVAESAQASADLVARQNEAGNVSDLVLATENGVFEQAKLDLSRSELDVAAARERLTRLMGLWGANTSWRAPSQLPNLPADEIPLERLESLAIAQRLDLGAARQSLQAVAYARSFASWSRWTGVIDVGAEVARLKSGAIVVGPSVALELPLFDQRQAVIARLEAQERAAALMVQALSIDIRSEVRAASYRVAWTRQVAEHYRKTLIPMKERIVELSQQEYDAMLLGVYQLILAKQSEASAYREYIETVRDYWIARSDLERAVGGKLTPKPASGAAAAIPAPAPPVSTGGAAPPPPAHHHQP